MFTSLIEFLVKQLVDAPQDVRVEQRDEGHKLIFTISVAAPDRKRVIGKDGRVVRSIRSLLQGLETQRKDILLEIAQ